MSLVPSQDQHKKIVQVLVPLFLIFALPVLLFSAKQTTEDQQQASQVKNLNMADMITHTNNADGTMGPSNSEKNYANTLPSSQQGSLTLLVTSSSQHPGVSPTGSSVLQNMTSLTLTVKKVEVHLSKTAAGHVDYWETLELNKPATVDLIQMEKGNASLLGMTNLASGFYSEVRMYIADPTAVFTDGTSTKLQFSGKSNMIRLTQTFTILKGSNTNLTLYFDVEHSVTKQQNIYIFTPVISNVLVSH